MKIRLSEVINSFKKPTISNKLVWAFLVLLLLRLMAALTLAIVGVSWDFGSLPSTAYLFLQGVLGSAACICIAQERNNFIGFFLMMGAIALFISGGLDPRFAVVGGASFRPIATTLVLSFVLFLTLRYVALRLQEKDRRAALKPTEPSSAA